MDQITMFLKHSTFLVKKCNFPFEGIKIIIIKMWYRYNDNAGSGILFHVLSDNNAYALWFTKYLCCKCAYSLMCSTCTAATLRFPGPRMQAI